MKDSFKIAGIIFSILAIYVLGGISGISFMQDKYQKQEIERRIVQLEYELKGVNK